MSNLCDKKLQRLLNATAAAAAGISAYARVQQNRRLWVHPVNRSRDELGEFKNLFKELKNENGERFRRYTRFSAEDFDDILGKVKPRLEKFGPRTICAEERLAMTLRYLASGDSMQSVAWAYRVGNSTFSGILSETCDAIVGQMWEEVIRCPRTEEQWLDIASGFEQRWQLPHCVGAIDGKHVIIEAPPNSGSEWFNYKKNFSMVLLAVADASYRFRYVNVGAYGSRSDGGIFAESNIGVALEAKTARLPSATMLPGSSITFPFFLAADEAFPLKEYMMRPFPGRGSGVLTHNEEIFNYRLCRGRRVIENAFGILSQRFRVFRRPIKASPKKIESIICAACCLHNFAMMSETERTGEKFYNPPRRLDEEFNEAFLEDCRRIYANETASFGNAGRLGANNYRQTAAQLRSQYAAYCVEAGALPWQDARINRIINQA